MSEMTAWLVQCGIIAAVLAAGAWFWELGARWSARPARWAWLIALAASVTVPFALRLLPEPTWSDVVPPVGVIRLDPVTVTVRSQASTPFSTTELGIALWVMLSLLVLAYAAVLLVRLTRARRKWRHAEVDGTAVLVSRNVGPAAVGVRRGMVVIPSWALQLDAELRQLMLLHEREHVRAGDPRLLLGALPLLAVMPWNPLVWLQVLRLRNAIELDCDARVLRQGVDPRRYGSLLLEVGLRRGGHALVFATFAEPRVFLEERIRRIARWPLQRRPLRAAALSLIAIALFSTSLLARVRVEAGPLESAQQFGVFGTVVDAAERLIHTTLPVDTPPPVPTVRPNPRQTPYTKAPVLLNTDAVMEMMASNYPARLRDARISGTAVVWVLVEERGQARYAQLSRASGYAALDEAAVKIANAMLFEPAQHGQRTVPAWIEVPIAFGQLAHSVSVTAQPTRRACADQRASVHAVYGEPGAAQSRGSGARTHRAVSAAAEGCRHRWNGPVVVLYRRERPRDEDAAQGLDRLSGAGRSGRARRQRHAILTGPEPRSTRTRVDRDSDPVPGQEAADGVCGRTRRVETESPNNADRSWCYRGGGGEGVHNDHCGAGEADPTRVITVPGTTEPAREAVRRPEIIGVYETKPETATRPRTDGPPVVVTQSTAPGQQDPDLRKRPAFTPFTVSPELLNREEIGRMLVSTYPPELRDASIGGTTLLWFFINEKGEVENTLVKTPSGFPALDEAALRVAKTMKFKAAQNRDRVVPVWIEIPIQFHPK